MGDDQDGCLPSGLHFRWASHGSTGWAAGVPFKVREGRSGATLSLALTNDQSRNEWGRASR